jgi:glycosyltransferase involved in cell wall biosynthesis
VKVLALTRYARLGATSRLRFLQYVDCLKKAGIEVSVGHFLGDEYVEQLFNDGRGSFGSIAGAYVRRFRQLFDAAKYDLVWIEKEVLPWLPALPEFIFASAGIRYVVDYDDAVFHNYDLHPNRLVRSLLGKKIGRVMSRASLVLAGNEYLAEHARLAGARHVEYLPTVVDLNRYTSGKQTASGVFTIGWIGSAWTSRYLPMVESALRQVCRNGAVRLLLIGSGPVTLADVPVEIRPWSEQREVSDIQQCDVGIMPLHDDAYERGKCGYKLIQYMACRLPVVASPVGVNSTIVECGKNGFLAATEKQWIDALEQLHNDFNLRNSMGERGRCKVEEEYSLQVHAPRLASLLRGARG